MYAIDSRNKGCIFKDGSGFHLKKKKSKTKLCTKSIKSGAVYVATNQGTPDSK